MDTDTMSNWPADPNVESVQRILARREDDLRAVFSTLRDLTECIEWVEHTKPCLDRTALIAIWDGVERVLSRYASYGLPADVTLRQQEKPDRGALSPLMDRVQHRMREIRGLDVASDLPEIERAAWTRELGLDLMAAVAQMFDATAGAFHPDDVAQFRRQRAKLALVHALEMAALHGVAVESVLRDLGSDSKPAACETCGGHGMVPLKSRWLGDGPATQRCSSCGGAGVACGG